MRERVLHNLIGRALTEPGFRAALLERPKDAIREFPFSEKERSLIGSVQAFSLEEFAQAVSERLEADSPEPNGRQLA
ncbi:MAG: Os1348 family NHLP clan protein [Anaerolineales bacterium]